MYTRVLGLTLSAVILAYGAVDAMAQDRMTTQPSQQQVQSPPVTQEGASPMGPGGMMGRGMLGPGMMGAGMMGTGMMGTGMMGTGMMTPPPMIVRIMLTLIDTDSDGTISLQEFQAAHERIFKAMDTSKDGKLTLEEMQAFMHGTR